MELAQGRDHCSDIVNVALNFRVLKAKELVNVPQHAGVCYRLRVEVPVGKFAARDLFKMFRTPLSYNRRPHLRITVLKHFLQ